MAKTSTEEKLPYQFPVGLRVLGIDNDPAVRENIKQMCSGCNYHVVTYPHALNAFNHVRERKNCVDVILIDVHMPSMDGYEILRHIMKEIDVPVIVMSVDDAKSSQMKSIKEGACDYWKKPLREDQFRDMWMHVARKAWKENKLDMRFGSLEDDGRIKRGNINDDSGFASSVIDATGGVRDHKKSISKESDVDELDDYYQPPAKKRRIIWTPDLRNKFDNAVTQLGGLDKAVPKRILELMNILDLTREHIASRLQKCRENAKNRSDGVTATAQQNDIPLPNTVQSSVGASRRSDSQALASTSNVCYETQSQAMLHPGLTSNLNLTAEEDQWLKLNYSHALLECPSDIANASMVISSSNALQQESLMRHQILSTNSASVPQNFSFSRSFVSEYGFLYPEPNNSLGVEIPGENNQVEDVIHGYTAPVSIPLQGSASDAALRSFPETVSDVQVLYSSRSSDSSLYQESVKNLEYVAEEMYMPRMLEGLQIDSPAASDFCNQNNTTEEKLPDENNSVS